MHGCYVLCVVQAKPERCFVSDYSLYQTKIVNGLVVPTYLSSTKIWFPDNFHYL